MKKITSSEADMINAVVNILISKLDSQGHEPCLDVRVDFASLAITSLIGLIKIKDINLDEQFMIKR